MEEQQMLWCSAIRVNQYRIDVDNNIWLWTLNPNTYCYYDFNFNSKACIDENSNNVEYILMSDRYKQLVQTCILIIKSYLEDVKNTIGYDFDELTW